ncbi:MAG: hypothetical protein ACKO3H_07155 [Verrucomicrobiota bacterium]
MSPDQIQAACCRIELEADPTVKNLMLASLVTTAFRDRGVELVVVGGSAGEFYTEGGYTSGDIDLCVHPRSQSVALRMRQEIMGTLGAKGGPRNWRLAGLFVDVPGPLKSSARTPLRQLECPFGAISVIQPEDLIAERVLVSVYPHVNDEARAVAKKLIAMALGGRLSIDWAELLRVVDRPEYGILDPCRALVEEVAHELGVTSPVHPA